MADMPSTPRRWTPGRIVLLVLGVLATLTALGLLAAGGALIWAQQTQRDSQGYFTTSAHRFAAQSYALATHSLDVAHDGPNWLFKSGRLGRIRIRATSEKPIFLGIAPAAAVSSYLGSTSYTEVKNVDYHPFRVDYVPKPGTEKPANPAKQHIWVASTAGLDTQTLTWPIEKGRWSKGKGCPDCRGTGYKGRIGVFEMILGTPEFRSAIARLPRPIARSSARLMSVTGP